jgi:ribosomal protein S18 acetylase RimI-like enzyme
LKTRQGNVNDLRQIKELAFAEWAQYRDLLTSENWEKLNTTLSDDKTFSDLMVRSETFVCESDEGEIMGFAFLVPSGNPTEIYSERQSYIRFLTASKKHRGQKVGQTLTEKCIERARENAEKFVALHTSEMMNAARHIYEKIGFRVIRELEPRLGKTFWLYELEL